MIMGSAQGMETMFNSVLTNPSVYILVKLLVLVLAMALWWFLATPIAI